MSVDRSDLHMLLDRVSESDLPVTRKLLALAADGEVATAESDGEFAEQAKRDVEAAEAFFDSGGEGIPHKDVLKGFDLA
jgi:hypothetical protein